MPRSVFTDQMGREVEISSEPKRIVSLVPSITELLFDLGLGDRVVGVTRFCIHPDEAKAKAVNIGGTKQLHIDRIREAQPDLIIGSKEENTKRDIEALAQDFPVWMSDVLSVQDGVALIREIGRICSKSSEAQAMAMNIERAFTDLTVERSFPRPRVAYLIWYDPIMGAGRQTFIDNVLSHCGWDNVLSSKPAGSQRYPKLDLSELIATDPEFILLSSEPYPFKEKHVNAFREALPAAQVLLVDGELFSWYGSRMLKMPAYLSELRRKMQRN